MNAPWEEIERACREVGLSQDILDRLRERLIDLPTPGDATPRELEIMKLIGTNSPDRLLHDVRNLLNEVTLLRALTNMDEEPK